MTQQAQIYVVFADQTQLWWLRGLKRGFRHCFVLWHNNAHWFVLDPMLNRLECQQLPQPQEFDFGTWLQSQGYKIMPAFINTNTVKPYWFLQFYSCVSVVKKFLNLQAPHILTPWQLYKFLHVSSTQTIKG